MKYISVCSGIEAATVAWHPLGWEPLWFSEIEPFPSAVLEHHHKAPNLGDMTNFKEWPDADVDVLVGGTPCQSFSVAGLRAGLADPRGNLMLTYLAIAARYRPRVVLWENVPGVLSSNGGRDFGTFLGGLAEIGYGFAYRVLDAQYFGLAQRRERVFVVGCLGDWRRAAAVLFEPEGLRWDPAPSRKAGQDVAPTVTAGAANGGPAHGSRSGGAKDSLIIPQPFEVANCLTQRMHKGINTTVDEGQTPVIAHTLRGEGFDATEDGSGRGTPLVPVAFHNRQDPDVSGDITHPLGAKDNGLAMAFDTTQITHPENRSNPQPGDPCHPLAAKCHAPAIAFDPYNQSVGDVTHPLRVGTGNGSGDEIPQTLHGMAVRRLTPLECERLQGFPDGYTAIPWRGKPADQCPDGPRYKALGNSMAVPVMRWIGRRIQMISEL